MRPKIAQLAALAATTVLALTGCSAPTAGIDTAMASVSAVAQQVEPFALVGDLTLYDTKTAGNDCFTSGGYADIGFGTTVVVTDDTNRTIAKGYLDFGQAHGVTCVFTFEIADVPSGSKFYNVEVSHRGAITFTADEARNYASVALGN